MINFDVWRDEKEFKFLEKSNYLLLLTEKYFNKFLVEKENFFKNKNALNGGVLVPHIIANRELIKEGVMAIYSEEDINSIVVSMKKPDLKLIDKIKDFKSIILFVDGLSSYLESFIKQIERVIGNSKIIGTGVGSRDLTQKQCLFDSAGVYQDYALILGLNIELRVGVGHGWKPLYGPLEVTKSEKNVVYQINGEPAFQVYKQFIKEREGIELNPNNFQEVVKAYPLGIKLKNEFIIRDPVAIGENDSIIVVSSIPSFSTIFIMKGNTDELVDSACKVSREVFKNYNGKSGLLIDCISRVLFMGDDGFKKEIDKIFDCAGKNDINIYGVTSIGEISNSGYDEIKIHNKSILLSSFEK